MPACAPRAAAAAALAQLCAFLNAVTAVASERLAGSGVPTFQSFLNYALLGAVYGALHARSVGRSPGRWQPAAPLRHYALLAAVDVEANFLIVKAYQYTALTSVTLLDSAAIPAAVLLSRWLLRASYSRAHLAGCALVLAGFVALVSSDTGCSASGAGAPAPAPLLGDALTVAAACLYATSNVLQERLLQHAPTGEVLALFGCLGALLAGVQSAALESRRLAAAPWDAAFVTPLLLFAGAMFAIYSLVPRVLPAAGAAAFNLHMLSSDLWAAAARSLLLGGFGGACAALGFSLSLLTVAAGLVVYIAAGAPGTERVGPAAASAAEEETGGLLAEEAVAGE